MSQGLRALEAQGICSHFQKQYIFVAVFLFLQPNTTTKFTLKRSYNFIYELFKCFAKPG